MESSLRRARMQFLCCKSNKNNDLAPDFILRKFNKNNYLSRFDKGTFRVVYLEQSSPKEKKRYGS